MTKMIDLTGERYGRLTVIERAQNTKSGRVAWLCKCDCGKITAASSNDLRRGKTISCGCLKKEKSAKHCIEDFKTHGETNSRLFRVWANIKKRCNNPHYKGFKDYGGRGISICEEWNNDYCTFKEWAITNGYDETAPRGKCTIDRIDNNGNYEPNNCRWVDMKVQNRNKRARRRV